MKLFKLAGLARIIPMVIATAAIGTSSASAAASKVVIVLGGQSFGHGQSLNLSSSPWRISPSKLYNYDIKATCFGEAPKNLPPGTLSLANVVPAGITLEDAAGTDRSKIEQAPERQLPESLRQTACRLGRSHDFRLKGLSGCWQGLHFRPVHGHCPAEWGNHGRCHQCQTEDPKRGIPGNHQIRQGLEGDLHHGTSGAVPNQAPTGR